MQVINSSVVTSGFCIKSSIPSITSIKLWVGILVVIPTAIPSAPFTNKFGIRTGNTSGSFSVSSKFDTKSTTFLSKSAR